MKLKKLNLTVIAGVACLFAHLASAQAPGAGVGAPSNGDPNGFGSQPQGSDKNLSPEQMRQFGDYMDKAKALNRKDLETKPDKEVVMQRAEQVIKALNLSCSPKDVALVGTSSDYSSGKVYQTSLYEVACSNSLGYFLSSRNRYRKDTGKLELPSPADSRAMTCFSAEGLHASDEAKGVPSEFYCQLPDNGGGDIKVMATRVLTAAGASCNVSQFKWFGVNEAAKTEYTELVCDGGTGYLLQTALPGTSTAPSAMNCVDASRKGLDCKLTKVAKLPTLQTFKDYLATTSVDCKVDDFNQIRVIGKENIKQRYVIEFKCPQQPNGLVAFIPLEGNANKFETLDCAAAKERNLNCKLNTAN